MTKPSDHLDNLLIQARSHECAWHRKGICWKCDEIDEAEAFFTELIRSSASPHSEDTK